MSLVGRILDGRPTTPAGGAYRWHTPDVVLLPEYALALIADRMADRGFVAKTKLLVVADHFAPPSTIERANILRRVQDLCQQHGLELRLFDGICHQLLIEDRRARPGRLIVGSDSHTVTAGALGAFACGVGSTDIYAAVAHGRVALRRPRVVRLTLSGRLAAPAMGKDLMLALFARFGPEAWGYAALECVDTDRSLSQSDRFTVCNLVAEAGGKAALFVPDAVTEAWLRQRDGDAEIEPWAEAAADDDADETYAVDLCAIEPMVSLPPDPYAAVPLASVAGVELHQVFLGSCNAGRLSDFAVAAEILAGRRVAPGLKAIAIPSSQQVYLDAIDAGYIRVLVAAGVTIGSPGCGPCGAIDKGLLADGERCAATINRNYEGRMGSSKAEIFLVNPAVAAASMVTGRLTDPRELA